MDFTVTEWAAWAPALTSRKSFIDWAHGAAEWGSEGVADVSFLPPRFRRRLTPLAKMGLHVAHHCIDQAHLDASNLRTVFASRFGEHMLTTHILREIIQNEVVSPMRFAMSVHNSTSGLFSIGSGNKDVTTAIAGGRETMYYALIEGIAMTHREPSRPVLVTMCEEPLDSIYHSYTDEKQCSYAVSFLLSANGPGRRIRLNLSDAPATTPESSDDLPLAMSMLKWFLCADENPLVYIGNRRRWNWHQQTSSTAEQSNNPQTNDTPA